MSAEQQTLEDVRRMISTLTDDEQSEVNFKAEELRQVIRSSKLGLAALSLVGAEAAADEEEIGAQNEEGK